MNQAKSRSILLFFCLTIIMVGCTNDQVEKKEIKATDKKEVEDKEKEDKEYKDKNEAIDPNYKQDIGNLSIWIGGEVIVKKNKIIVNGKSNLLPGSVISSSGVSTLSIGNFSDKADVQEDGTFHFKFPPYEGNATVTFRLSTLEDSTDKQYGGNLEKVTGPQVYRTARHGEFKVTETVKLVENKKKPYTLPIETPEWDKLPDDYGDPDIWIDNVEVTSDHQYFYIHGKSNLVEGTSLFSHLTSKSGDPITMAYDGAKVHPDGSFDLKVRYYSLSQGMYIPIQVKGTNYWDDVVTAYGENMEKVEGDLVKKDDEGHKYIEYIVEVDVPEIEPPEKVDLTVADEEIKMKVPDNLLFEIDKSKLKKDAKKSLDVIISDLEELPSGTVIQINGHTDNNGDPKHNMKLSKARAASVLAYLKKHGDIKDLDIHKQGFGETKPIESNEDSSGRSENRRVEIVINPDK